MTDSSLSSGAPAQKKSFLRRPAVLVVVAAVAVLAVGYLIHWLTVGRFLQSTNDAYLQADLVSVAPKVSGYISEVLVKDNQSVVAGQPLVRIDAENYRAVLARQKANFDARTADIAAAEAQARQQLAAIEQAKAKLAGSRVNAEFAAREAERYRKLAANGAETAERLAQMINRRDDANATLQSDTAALIAAQRQAETLQAQIGQARAQAEAAQATAQEADLDFENAVVKASIAGRVGDRTARVGQFVQPGTRLLSIVPVQNIYVTANFKETQIADMRVGQPAEISVDALGGRKVRGVIDSFSPGTGAQFALLPPENATGNFTKIVQRVPVRLRVDADDETRARLLPGLSVTVEINTGAAPTESGR
jgi:membrane fusion protein (multidrug efflux system)